MDRAAGQCEAVDHHDDCGNEALRSIGVRPLQWAHIYGKGMGGSAMRDCAANTCMLSLGCHDILDGRTRHPLGLLSKQRRLDLWVKVNVWPLVKDWGSGPCLICNTGLPAVHRAADAVWDRCLAGEDPHDVAADYGIDGTELGRLYGLWEQVSR